MEALWKRSGRLLPGSAAVWRTASSPRMGSLGGGAAGLIPHRRKKRRRGTSRSPTPRRRRSRSVARMTSPSYFANTATLGQTARPRASEPKRAGSARRWTSAPPPEPCLAPTRLDSPCRPRTARSRTPNATFTCAAGPTNGRGQAEPITRAEPRGYAGEGGAWQRSRLCVDSGDPVIRRDSLRRTAPFNGGSTSQAGSPLPIRIQDGAAAPSSARRLCAPCVEEAMLRRGARHAALLWRSARTVECRGQPRAVRRWQGLAGARHARSRLCSCDARCCRGQGALARR